MDCLPKNAAKGRYLRRFQQMMALYATLLVGDNWAFTRHHPTGTLAYLLAVLPAIPIVGVIAVVAMYLKEETDEFVRTLLVQAMTWGIGLTLATTTVWGFLENFAGVPHLQPFLVFPMFCFFAGVSQSLLRRSYR